MVCRKLFKILSSLNQPFCRCHTVIYFCLTLIAPERLINQPWPDKMASSNMKDNFLYLAPVANTGLLSYIKQSSIGNVPAETITTLVALILPETPLYKHCTQGCVLRPKGTHTYQNRMEAFIMFSVGLQTLLNFLPAGRICFLCHQATVFLYEPCKCLLW